jgi:hypothetical protein
MHALNHYQLFGLTTASHLPLPVPPVDAAEPVEVEVVRGPVPVGGALLWRAEPPDPVTCWRVREKIVLAWPDVRFAVSQERVVVDTKDLASAAALLVPAAWSVLLATRGQESLHGSALERDGRAVAVLGESGSGKSSAALALVDCGWRLLTDDLLVFGADRRVVPGPPMLRLPADRAAGRAGEPDRTGKHRVSVTACVEPAPLAAAIVLADRYDRCRRLTGTMAASALLEQVYAPFPLDPAQTRRRFALALDLVATARIYGAPPRSLTAAQLEGIAEGREA